jgi:hypothetical protein
MRLLLLLLVVRPCSSRVRIGGDHVRPEHIEVCAQHVLLLRLQ